MMLDMTLLPGEQNGVMEDELLVNNTSARPSNVIIIHIIIIILFVTLTPYSYSKVGHRWEPKDSVGPQTVSWLISWMHFTTLLSMQHY